jgi:hypothetical protein
MKEGSPQPNRREFLRGAGAVALTLMPGAGALGRALDARPDLSRELLALQQDLAKGGRYHFALQDKRFLTNEFLSGMIERMARVSAELRNIHHKNRAPLERTVGEYILSDELPGLAQQTFYRTQRVGQGKVADGYCNVFFLHSGESVFKVAAHHCVEGTTEEEAFSSIPEKYDLSVREARGSEYSGQPLIFDGDLSREDAAGWVGVTVGEKFGTKDAFYGPLVPMTDAFFQYMFGKGGIEEPFATHIKNGFWKVLPPGEGSVEAVHEGKPVFKAQGRSGSIEVAYDPKRGGYTTVGNFIGIVSFASGPLRGRTIGFYSGPEAIQETIKKNKERSPRETRLTR